MKDPKMVKAGKKAAETREKNERMAIQRKAGFKAWTTRRKRDEEFREFLKGIARSLTARKAWKTRRTNG